MKLNTAAPICALLIAGAATAADSAQRAGPESAPPVLRVRLAAPGRVALAEGQIRNAVSGKVLLLDEIGTLAPGVQLDVVIEGGCPPVERFFADGRWERQFCARAPRIDHGRWRIQTGQFGSQLCVAIEGEGDNCRPVWRRSSPDRLILPVNRMHSSGDPEFNPYRTVPL
jgi:hypothetical protein